MASPKRKPRTWMPEAKLVTFRPGASTLADVTPLLARLVTSLGTNATGRLLGADRAQISRWSKGTEKISSERGRRIIDLHDVLTRILRICGQEAAANVAGRL